MSRCPHHGVYILILQNNKKNKNYRMLPKYRGKLSEVCPKRTPSEQLITNLSSYKKLCIFKSCTSCFNDSVEINLASK